MRYRRPPPVEQASIQNTNREVNNMQEFDAPQLFYKDTYMRKVLPRAPQVNEIALYSNVHTSHTVSVENVAPGLRGQHLSLVSELPMTHRLPHYESTYDS
jgi:hypothetical protein